MASPSERTPRPGADAHGKMSFFEHLGELRTRIMLEPRRRSAVGTRHRAATSPTAIMKFLDGR